MDVGLDLQLAYESGYEQGKSDAVVHGKWEKITGMAPPEYHGHYSCSECGWLLRGFYSGNRENSFNFCPNCGARMAGDSDV